MNPKGYMFQKMNVEASAGVVSLAIDTIGYTKQTDSIQKLMKRAHGHKERMATQQIINLMIWSHLRLHGKTRHMGPRSLLLPRAGTITDLRPGPMFL